MKGVFAELVAAGMLAVLVVGSGVWVVEAEHEARQLFAELEGLHREKDRLQIDWGRLRLEQSTWATQARIESVARGKLDLADPTDDQVVVIAEPGS
jgi:cell division protein FtsL